MFNSIKWIRFNRAQEVNYLLLYDPCISQEPFEIKTPSQSPSLKESNLTNALIVYSLIIFYQEANRRIPREIAKYYQYMERLGFDISETFIRSQLETIDQIGMTNFSKRYLKSIIRYLNEPKAISSLDELFDNKYEYSNYLNILKKYQDRGLI